jgi:glycosyltransferase involved in cell wall biosynthesis
VSARPDTQRKLTKIVAVNTTDRGAGAESVAWNLFKGFQRRGVESWLVVGDKKTPDPHVLPFFSSPYVDYTPYADSAFKRALDARRQYDLLAGIESFDFPYSKYLPTLTGSVPDVTLCHNLHGGYFDLRTLRSLSGRGPVFVSLHDNWMFTGHCGYPLGCARWQTGCGQCPDLSLPPAIRADGSAHNWQEKAQVYKESRLHVSASTRWLLERAQASMLAPAIVDSRIIPCPVDMQRFRVGARAEARHDLGLPQTGHVVVYAAFKGRSNPYKDYATIASALERLAALRAQDEILFIALGEEAPDVQVGKVRFRFLPFQTAAMVARYLRAADIYVHAARAEAFGLIAAEAAACGTPAVSTAVGGLSEVVMHEQTGLLVPAQDADGMARAIDRLLGDPVMRERMGQQAAAYARLHWDQEHVLDLYHEWFEEVLNRDFGPDRMEATQ